MSKLNFKLDNQAKKLHDSLDKIMKKWVVFNEY